MAAEESLREGRIGDALDELKDQVRKDPADPKLRTFLFQLLAVTGDWERALNQLKVVGEMDAAALPMLQTYQEAIQCEALRKKVFAGETSPLVFGEPEEWIALLFESLKLVAGGRLEDAAELRNQAFEGAPTTSGKIDDQAFEWIADADPRMGPAIEAVVNGRYYWVPFHRIREIHLEEPADLRDFVWAPAQFVWANGGQTVGFIPTRYPGSESSEDDLIRLSRKTEWVDAGGETWLGSGQRLFATDAGEFPLLDARKITLDVADLSAEDIVAELTADAQAESEPLDG
ncbi:MAG: type VI secretion system accessory protein TagJ [Planctomycetota bacterium]